MIMPAEVSEPSTCSGGRGGPAPAPGVGHGRPAAGPDLLAEAAMVLPSLAGRGPVRWADVHAAIYQAAGVRGVGRDRPHRLRLADETLDMFTEYLVAAGLAAAVRCPTHGWLACARLPDVQLALAAAAGHWRRARPATLDDQQ